MRNPLYLLLALVVVAACENDRKEASEDSAKAAAADPAKTAATPQDDDAAKDAIAKARTAWKAAADKKDAAAVAALYTDDAVFVGSETPPATGKAEIQKAIGQSFAVSSIGSIDSKETVVRGDLGYDYGTFTQTVAPPNAKPRTVNGYYMVVLRKQADGSWKLARHLSTTPPPKA